MGPGGIATIIAASALAVIALAIAYLIIRVGKLVDQASATIDDLTNETAKKINYDLLFEIIYFIFMDLKRIEGQRRQWDSRIMGQ